jgi:6-phosphogluconolactonase
VPCILRSASFGLFALVSLMLTGAAKADGVDFNEYEHRPATPSLYTSTNLTEGNTVLAYRREANGSLTFTGDFPTGGTGIGGNEAPGNNQGALALNENQRWLIVVNSGSNDVTVFAVFGHKLAPISKTPSGGLTPVSVTIHEDLVYVLNQGSGSIAGFRLNEGGQLTPIVNSTRTLGDASAVLSTIAFSPDGKFLVVTERDANKIAVFLVGDHGHPAATPVITKSNGDYPFGFEFARDRTIIVSEAQDLLPGAGTVSSYRLHEDGTLSIISGSIKTYSTAACWVAVTPSKKYTYVSDTVGPAVSSFSVLGDGVLVPQTPVSLSLSANTAPTDLAVTPDSRFLYILDPGNVTTVVAGQILAFRINTDGNLTQLPSAVATGILLSSTGLVIR